MHSLAPICILYEVTDFISASFLPFVLQLNKTMVALTAYHRPYQSPSISSFITPSITPSKPPSHPPSHPLFPLVSLQLNKKMMTLKPWEVAPLGSKVRNLMACVCVCVCGLVSVSVGVHLFLWACICVCVAILVHITLALRLTDTAALTSPNLPLPPSLPSVSSKR